MIAIIVPAIVNAAPVRIACEQANWLAATGYNVKVLTLATEKHCKKLTSLLELNGIEIMEPTCKNIMRLRTAKLIHSHGFRPDFFSAMLLGSAKYRISTIHSYALDELRLNRGVAGLIQAIAWIFLLKKMNFVFTLSNHASKVYGRLGINTLTLSNPILPGGNQSSREISIDQSTENMILELKKTSKLILGSNCALLPVKGIWDIIKVVEKYPDFAAIIVGSGPMATKLTRYIRAKGLATKIILLGSRSTSEVISISRHYDVYVSSSKSEGFGLSILEAILNSTPVVSTNLSSIREIFAESISSYYDPGNLLDLKRACWEASSATPEFLRSAANYAISNFSGEKIRIKYLDSLQKILSAN